MPMAFHRAQDRSILLNIRHKQGWERSSRSNLGCCKEYISVVACWLPKPTILQDLQDFQVFLYQSERIHRIAGMTGF
jgi:hypothetical protein